MADGKQTELEEDDIPASSKSRTKLGSRPRTVRTANAFSGGCARVLGGWSHPKALVRAPRGERLVGTDKPVNTHLRSAKELIGYHVRATDNEVGHIVDFMFDDESWEIRYLAVDMSDWWFGKKVLLPPKGPRV